MDSVDTEHSLADKSSVHSTDLRTRAMLSGLVQTNDYPQMCTNATKHYFN